MSNTSWRKSVWLTGDRSSVRRKKGRKDTPGIWSLPVQVQNPLADPACRRGDDGLGHTCRKSWQRGLPAKKYVFAGKPRRATITPVMIKNQYLSLRRPHHTRSADRPPWLASTSPRSWSGGTSCDDRRINYKFTIYRTWSDQFIFPRWPTPTRFA